MLKTVTLSITQILKVRILDIPKPSRNAKGYIIDITKLLRHAEKLNYKNIKTKNINYKNLSQILTMKSMFNENIYTQKLVCFS